MTPSSDACRSCGAPIVWAVTGEKRRRIPLDAVPVADGNVELLDMAHPRSVGDAPYTVTWGSSHTWPPDVRRYRSHFATCPQAGEWRTGR